MDEFLLDVDGQILRVLIEDSRGPKGSLPALVSSDAASIRILPQSKPKPPPPGKKYPGFPQKLRSLQLDVSGLPAGPVQFSIGKFTEQAASLASTTEIARFDLTLDDAKSWGFKGPIS
jgi:hypothetical protein